MKTFKQFNEEAQYNLHELPGEGVGFPLVGPIVKGGATILKQLAKPHVYRGIGAVETGRQLYKDIKNKKSIGKTIANTAGNVLTTVAPYHKGFLKSLKSKRFLGGVGLNAAGSD